MPTIVKNGKEYKVCPRCHGKGFKPRDWYPADGVCYNCGGRGYYDMNERRQKRMLDKLRGLANDFIHNMRADDKFRSTDIKIEDSDIICQHMSNEHISGPTFWIKDEKNSRYFLARIWNRGDEKYLSAVCLYEIPADKFEAFVEAAKLFWGDNEWYGYPTL